MKKSFFLLLVILPTAASAFFAEVIVDVGRERINAIEGVVHVPLGVPIHSVYTGHSAVLIWLKEPVFDEEKRTIAFSGITPGGGFTGKEALLTVSGEFDESDLPSFTFSTVNALRDDGEATSVPVKLSLIEAQLGVDTAPPEPFSPLISSSPDIFEGTSFLSFFAQDKDTGIEGYEYAVTWLLPPNNNKDWQKAESPLLLSRPMLFQKIYIRALDHAGNDRTVSTPGPYRYYLTIFGVIMLLCVLLLLRRSFHSRSSLPY